MSDAVERLLPGLRVGERVSLLAATDAGPVEALGFVTALDEQALEVLDRRGTTHRLPRAGVRAAKRLGVALGRNPLTTPRRLLDDLATRAGASGLTDQEILPVIGTKELVAWLPTLLGIGPGDSVMFPATAYPTYEVGALLAGARPDPSDDPGRIAEVRPKLVWINSPANPHGAILDRAATKAWVDAARAAGAVLASDEGYGEFAWDAEPVSVLDDAVCGGDHTGLLSVMSLSKRSNVAGFRAGWVAGDAALTGELLGVRKHAGMMVPGPIQDVMVALLDDQQHVAEQRDRYRRRRDLLRPSLERAGFRIDNSEGSLYLWATRGEDCRATLDVLAGLGIVAAPGDFYGEAGRRHVRIALTASDERVAEAARRLSTLA